jgi:hypothetical protein
VNNRTNLPLDAGRTYIGSYDSVLQFSTAVILVNTDTTTQLTIYQSPDKSRTYTEIINIAAGSPFTKILNITSPFLYTTLRNTSGSTQTFLNYEVIYREVSVVTPASVGANVNIFDSNGNDLNSTSNALNVYLTNSLTVAGTVDVANFPATQTVAGTVDIANFPATQTVAGTVDIANFPGTQTVAGTVDVANFPATQTVAGTVYVNGNTYDGNNLDIRIADIKSSYISNDNVKVSIQEQSAPLEITSLTRVSSNFAGTLVAGSSYAFLSLNTYNVGNISVFGSVAGTCVLAVEMSADNSTYFTSQYSVNLTGASEFGFTISCAASYVRVKRTDAGGNIQGNVNIQAC